jgi:hypothetical protein
MLLIPVLGGWGRRILSSRPTWAADLDLSKKKKKALRWNPTNFSEEGSREWQNNLKGFVTVSSTKG